jgi:hypothetical protein
VQMGSETEAVSAMWYLQDKWVIVAVVVRIGGRVCGGCGRHAPGTRVTATGLGHPELRATSVTSDR